MRADDPAEQFTVANAWDAARDWVMQAATREPGYVGAFIAGSIASLPGSTPLPATSDIDVMLVTDGDQPGKGGKLRHEGFLLEATWLHRSSLEPVDHVLGAYHLAHALHSGLALHDPSGWLTGHMAHVRSAFARRSWVERRVANARERVVAGFDGMRESRSLAESAQSWVFPTGVMTHILLVSGLRNPTVRRRYETVRDLLAHHGLLNLHEDLLVALGSSDWRHATAQRHLDTVTELYDTAAKVEAPAYPYSSDVSPLTRPISIDGSREMIAHGLHREAAFWLVVTGSRALQKLAAAGEVAEVIRFEPRYAALLADLGAATWRDRVAHRNATLELLPRVDATASAIMDATLEITP